MHSFIAQSKKLWSETRKRPSKKLAAALFKCASCTFYSSKAAQHKAGGRGEPPAVLYLLHGKCA